MTWLWVRGARSLCPALRTVAVSAALGVLTAAGSAGQVRIEDTPVFSVFGMEEGLSQGSVQALHQDRTGYIWIGTQDGLNRYDGVSFRAYKNRRDDPSSLSENFIRAITGGEDERLWVGTDREGLNLFDPATGRSVRYPLEELGPWRGDTDGEPSESRRGRTVSGIVPLSDGTLGLLSDAGLAHFDPAAQTAFAPPLVDELQDPASICELSQGAALVGFEDGRILRWSDASAPLRHVATVPGAVRALDCSEPGSVHVATALGEIFLLEPESGNVVRVARVDAASPGDITVYDVLWGPANQLWIATAQGLHTVAPGQEVSRRVGDHPTRGLPDAQVMRFLVDRGGVLWVGTWNGLARLHPLSRTMRRVFNARFGAPGLSGDGVISVAQGGPDSYWLGTMAGGVHLLTSEPQSNALSVRPSEVLRSLTEARIYDLTRGPEGELWVAAMSEGIVRLDPGGGRARSVPIDAPLVDGRSPRALSVFVDRSGEVWAGTLRHGLLKLDADGSAFRQFRGPTGEWEFGSPYVWPIAEDARGFLWVGAYNGGLSSIDPQRRQQTLYSAGPEGLADDRILTVFADSRGWIWVGSEGGGLSRLDPATEEVVVYTVEDGLPHDHVVGIIEDDEGYLWVSTNDGLARLDTSSGDFRVLTEAAGLAGDRFYANSVYKATNGDLFFGGEAGLTILDPGRVGAEGSPPPIAITSFRIHGDEQPLARALDPRGLDLAPSERFFTLEFAALDFLDPTQNRYRYQLDPLNEDWVDAGASGVANYTSVPPGRYSFRVEARGSNGVWNQNSRPIPIRVRAPFYQTTLFRIAMAVAVLSLVTAIYAYRLTELKRRQALRLRIAGQLHDDIGANLSTIALKANMLQSAFKADPKRQNQLGKVAELARDAAHKVRETVWVVNTAYDTIDGLVRKMRDTADVMLEGQVDYRFNAPQELPDHEIDMELRQDVYLLFKESLQNVIKHADAQNVDIVLDYRHPNLTLRVQDDGVGFDTSNGSNGNGLGLMKGRAEKHGGDLSLTAAPGAGTTMSLRVRMK